MLTYPTATNCNSAASSFDDGPKELNQAFEGLRELIGHDPLLSETLLHETIGIVQPQLLFFLVMDNCVHQNLLVKQTIVTWGT